MLFLGDLHLKRASEANEAGSTIADPKQALSYRIGFDSELGSRHWVPSCPHFAELCSCFGYWVYP